jgi:hypothetical protein
MAAPVRLAMAARAVETGTPVALFPTRLASGASIGTAGSSSTEYAVATNGRFLMNLAADDAVTSPITIVLNWQSGLAAREIR